MSDTCEGCKYHEAVIDHYNGATVGHDCWRPIVPVRRSSEREAPVSCPDKVKP